MCLMYVCPSDTTRCVSRPKNDRHRPKTPDVRDVGDVDFRPVFQVYIPEKTHITRITIGKNLSHTDRYVSSPLLAAKKHRNVRKKTCNKNDRGVSEFDFLGRIGGWIIMSFFA
jgi:hypothetical protein